MLRVSLEGEVEWVAHLPREPGYTDAFTSIRLVDKLLVAFAGSGYAVTIDPVTGETVSKVFTK